MNKPTRQSRSTTRTTAPLILLAACGLIGGSLCGCGGSSDDTVGDAAQQEGGPQPSGLPVDMGLPINPAGGTMPDLTTLLASEACQPGWVDDEGESGRECAATFRSVCFEDNEAACDCAGCGADICMILESYPTQVSCPQQGVD